MLPMAAPAANLQQELPYWLKRQPARRPLSAASEAPVLRPCPCLLRIAMINLLVIASFFIIFAFGIILITTRCRQNLHQIETRALLLGGCDRPHEGFDHPAILSASPGVISPPASAEVTAFIACETSRDDGPQISPGRVPPMGGRRNLTVRSRHGGSTRSMQSRIAVGS